MVSLMACFTLASFSVFISPVWTSWIICDRLAIGFVCSIVVSWYSLEAFPLSSRDKTSSYALTNIESSALRSS